MSTNSAVGIQTFNTAFPLDFSIKNQFQDEDLPILYIVNSIDKTAASQKLKIQINSTTEESYTLKGFGFTPISSPSIPTIASSAAQIVPNNPNPPITPGPTKYNLAVAIRPGTLRSAVEENFATSLYKGLTASFGTSNPNSCIVNGPIPRKSDGALVWYVAFEKDIVKPMKPINEWKKIDDGKQMKDMIFLNEGGLLGVDSNDNIYTRSKIEGGAWTQEGLPTWLSSKKAISLAGNSYENIVLLKEGAYSNLVVTPPSSSAHHPRSAEYASADGSWIFPTTYGTHTNFCLSLMPDDSFAMVGTDNRLYQYFPSGVIGIDTSLSITNITAKPDGSVLGISLNGYLHARSNMIPSSQPLAGTWTKLDGNTQLSCLAVDDQGAILACDSNGNFYQQASSRQLLEFELEGISAEAGTGTRGTQIEMLFGNVETTSGSNPLSFKRSQHLNIINHDGHSYAPLHFGLIGDSTLLNKKEHQNSFSLFFETIDGQPIALNQAANEHTKIHFDFPYSDGGKNLMPFGNSSEVGTYQLTDSEAYPFLSSGPFNSGGDIPFDASTNEGGSIRFTAGFKDLTKEQEAKETNPSAGITASENLFNKVIAPVSGSLEEKITNTDKQSTKLAAFLTAADGPMQYYMYASGAASSATISSFYGSPNSDESILIPVNPEPSSSNPVVVFNESAWLESFNQKGSHIPFTIPNEANSPSINDWNTLPEGYTPLSKDYSFSDPDFLLYVSLNYTLLIRQLYVLNSLVLTGKCKAPNGQVVTGILPCKVLYEYFKIQYELDKSINETSNLNLENGGVQQMAGYYARIANSKYRFGLFQEVKTLVTFMQSDDGPILTAFNVSINGSILTYASLLSELNQGYEFGFSIIKESSGQIAPFTKEYWNSQFKALKAGNDDDFPVTPAILEILESLPSDMKSDYSESNTWSDPDFLNYVTDNFNLLVELYCQQMKIPSSISKSDIPMPAINAIYTFFHLYYKLSQVENQANFMLGSWMSTETTHSTFIKNWDIAFSEAFNVFGANQNLLLKGNKSAQSWSDSNFIAYIIENFNSKVSQLNKYNYNWTNYIVPCQALYDYFWYCYQSSSSAPSPESKEELYNPFSYAFNFSNIQVSGEDGWLTIGIRVENLPGYWDSSFQVAIRKSKTIFAPTLALGRGGPNGRTTFLPTDPNYTNANGLNPGSRIDFLSAGENSQKQPNVSIEEYYGLNLYGTLPETGQSGAVGVPTKAGVDAKAGQSVRVKQADFLVEDGRLGIGNVPEGDISGDFSNPTNINATNPKEKLRVVGDSYLNGHAGISGDAGIGGNLSVQGNFNVMGQLDVNDASIFPTGAIRMQFGSWSDTPPEGWLLCNGESIMDMMCYLDNGQIPVFHLKFLSLFRLLNDVSDKFTEIKYNRKAGEFSLYSPLDKSSMIISGQPGMMYNWKGTPNVEAKNPFSNSSIGFVFIIKY